MSTGVRRFLNSLFLSVFAVAVCALLTSSAWGQEVSAGITGTVTDPSGAAVPGANVTVRDINRGTEWPTLTNDQGIYAFPRIPTGTYELKVEMAGFKTVTRPGIHLELNQRARVDIKMEIGDLSQTVEVAGAQPMLNTETTTVGSVISSNAVVNTPLVTRNYIALTLLAPGVTTTNPADFKSGVRTGGGGRPYVNGNRKEANNFLLDGIDNNHTSDNLTSYQPNLDAIQEVKMITNNASAEFGNFQGGVINVMMKSGTNDYHGSLFEFFRNDKLNANNWGRNWSLAPDPKTGKSPRSLIRWNEFGGTFGGPIKRDRIFVFGDYQGIRRATPPSVGRMTVIPEEFRQGDFSRLLSERGIQLYDPLTTDAAGMRQPFANNQIPMNRINPVAAKLFASEALYPLPINSELRFNQLNAASSQLVSDQFDVKLDAKLSERDDFSARYSWGRQELPGHNTFPLTFDSFNHAPFRNIVFNWTRSFNPSLVNELRIGANRIMNWNGGEDKGLGNVAEDLGIAEGNDRGPGLMAINFTGGLSTSIGNANIGTQQKFPNNTFHYADNLTIIRGRHIFKTGGQLLRQQMNPFYAGNNGRTGFITFNGQYTAGPNALSPTSKGFAEADFFLGTLSRAGRGLNTGSWGHRKNILGFYFQDDWRATSQLTLNIGLRWEYHSPLVEVYDRQSNFEPFTGKMMLAGKDGNSRALYNPFKKDFQPRLGFAWTPQALGGRTVFRGAYTISSFMEGTGTNLRLPMNPPFNVEYEAIFEGQTAIQATLDQGLTILQAADPYKNATIRLWDPNVRPANVQQWSLILEQQLFTQTVVTAGYIGQHGTHLIVPMPYFQRQLLPDKTTIASPYLAGNPLLASIAQISGTEACGNQRYDSLQITARQRYAKGLEYQFSYTYSKGMSDAIGYYGEGGQSASQSAYFQNLYDRKAEWGPTYFDATNMVSFVYTYELPFGQQKTFGTNWNPVLNAVLGGWQMGGILSLRSGFPLTITATDRSGTKSRGARADRVGDGEGPKQAGPGTTWLDKTAFKEPVAGTFGNSGVGVVRGPGWKTFDLSVHKSFRVTEQTSFQFRTEFFNLTNTPQFSTPNRSASSATFGEITGAQGERNVQFALKLLF
ncbi:MAG: carboxypeptidase regulatory-like domain-containing protein [Acidobacteria bacterium]|nr:MAG: carboxypeptidase regulatory-like domain-containing protein [Acidobacteriota bacterium]